MTDAQLDGIIWLALVNAEDRRARAPERDHARLWIRRALWTLRGRRAA